MTTRRLRSVANTLVALLFGAFVFSACPDPIPLPLAGWAEFQDLLFVRVPGGSVNVGGGNFLTRRTDLSIDTRIGTYTLGATYNSASGAWRWAHEMTYVGSIFVDESGASFDLTGIAYGSAIPGTHWVVLDADSIKTKGGLVHDFSATNGKLTAIHWLGFDYPRLSFTTQVVGEGTERVTAIDQCTAATTCTRFFTFLYFPNALLQTVTDRANRIASFTWDTSGRLETAKDGLDTVKGWLGVRYEYSGTNLTAMTNSENERVEYTYDSSARCRTAKKIGDGNPTSSFDYFPLMSDSYYLTRFTNPLAEQANFRYDGNRLTRSIELVAVGETTTFLWSGRRVSRVTRPDTVQTNFVITNDDVTQVTEASGNITTITYAPNAFDPGSPNARPIDLVSDSVGPVLDRGYDGFGRLTSVANGAGGSPTTYVWNTGSPTELASVQSPVGSTTTFGGPYGEHGHPASATTGVYPNVLTESYLYDAVGNLERGPDTSSELAPGMGGVVSRTFDADRGTATVVLENEFPYPPYNQTMTLEPRSDGRLRAIRPPYGGDTEFLYSTTGRVLTRREKANGAWVNTSFGYDALGRVNSAELANGMRSELGYDGAGRVRTITSKRSGVIEETLTRTFAAGRLTSSVDSAFTGSETYAYDSAGRVSTITYPGGERRELGYDLRSRVNSEKFFDAAEVKILELTYAYDLANRVTEVRLQPFSILLLKYTYTNGFVTKTEYGNGLTRNAIQNTSFGLPLETITTNAQSQELENTDYDYDNGIVISRASTIDGDDQSADGFLMNWQHSGSRIYSPQYFQWDSLTNPRTTYTQLFDYNPEANRLTQTRSASSPTTVVHTYGYDAAGFATSRDGVTLGYDATGAIASIGSVAAFDHDLDGRPISRTLNGTTKLFRFGGSIAYSTSGSPIELDLGEIVIKLDGTYNHRYRHLDFRGNVLFVSRQDGTIQGHVQNYQGFGVGTIVGTLGERGFAGGFRVNSLGLTVLGPRVLDPDTGRFLSQDPVFNAVNQYAYAQGNPVFLWDPLGAVSQTTATVAGVVVGAGVATAVTIAIVVSAPATGTLGALWLVASSLGGGFTAGRIALGALNLAFEAADPNTARWTGLPAYGPFSGSVSLEAGGWGGAGGLGGGIQGGSGNPPGPGDADWGSKHPETRRRIDIEMCRGGVCSGSSFPGSNDGVAALGSLNFSIALSFAGAAW